MIFALVATMLALSSAEAADACGGVGVGDGAIETGRALATGDAITPEDRACLDLIGARLVDRGGVRTMTIAARVPDAERAGGLGTSLGTSAGARLAEAGIPAARITVIQPPLGPGQERGIRIAFTESRAVRPVGMVVGVTGEVESIGPSGSRPTQPGDRLPAGRTVRTGPGASAVLGLADGSRIRVESSTTVVLERLTLDDQRQRRVELRVDAGEVTAIVERRGGAFKISTPAGVAGVRGTSFRVSQQEPATQVRLETLTGRVNLSAGGDVDVGAGMGSRVADGQTPEPPRKLPAAPVIQGPGRGPLGDGGLSWERVRGAPGWRVELARDAEFAVEVRRVDGERGVRHSPDLPEGGWFWRVAAVDRDGFTGDWSRVYRFEVRPSEGG